MTNYDAWRRQSNLRGGVILVILLTAFSSTVSAKGGRGGGGRFGGSRSSWGSRYRIGYRSRYRARFTYVSKTMPDISAFSFCLYMHPVPVYVDTFPCGPGLFLFLFLLSVQSGRSRLSERYPYIR